MGVIAGKEKCDWCGKKKEGFGNYCSNKCQSAAYKNDPGLKGREEKKKGCVMAVLLVLLLIFLGGMISGYFAEKESGAEPKSGTQSNVEAQEKETK